jgi:hypothetical protein
MFGRWGKDSHSYDVLDFNRYIFLCLCNVNEVTGTIYLDSVVVTKTLLFDAISMPTYVFLYIQMEGRVHRFFIDNNSNVGKRLSILHMYLCRIGRGNLTSWQVRFELLPYVNPKIPEYCRQNSPLKILKKILHKINVVLALLTFLALFCDWSTWFNGVAALQLYGVIGYITYDAIG